MPILSKLNAPFMYLICGSIVLFAAVLCVVFALRAYRQGKAIGMDVVRMRRVITSSATFTVIPSIGILLGVIALSGALGTPWPWLRLSVIGALHYETQVAGAAAEATGLSSLSGSEMTPQAFVNIALLMSVCIIWGMVFCIFNCESYTKKLSAVGSSETKKKDKAGKKSPNLANFGDIAMTAMFIGLVSAYMGSYIGGWISKGGLFSFGGSPLPLAVAFAAAIAMGIFSFVREKWNAEWVDSFSIAGSMIIAMGAAIFLARII